MQLLSTVEAAKILGFTPNTLRNARCRGSLAGVAPPKYRKLGTCVRYEREALINWKSQFLEQTSGPNSVAGK